MASCRSELARDLSQTDRLQAGSYRGPPKPVACKQAPTGGGRVGVRGLKRRATTESGVGEGRRGVGGGRRRRLRGRRAKTRQHRANLETDRQSTGTPNSGLELSSSKPTFTVP